MGARQLPAQPRAEAAGVSSGLFARYRARGRTAADGLAKGLTGGAHGGVPGGGWTGLITGAPERGLRGGLARDFCPACHRLTDMHRMRRLIGHHQRVCRRIRYLRMRSMRSLMRSWELGRKHRSTWDQLLLQAVDLHAETSSIGM
ncbi:unnamed protein product [Calypogeia fissa]